MIARRLAIKGRGSGHNRPLQITRSLSAGGTIGI